MLLKDKTALVTGGSRGIGRAIAIRLAEEGADVAVNYVSRAKDAGDVAEIIRAKGVKSLPVMADVGNYEQVEKMVSTIRDDLGPVDILVNNASVHRGGRVEKLSIDDWDLVMKADLYGPYFCSRLCVPMMKEKKWGKIVHISSSVGIHGFAGDAAYGSAKAGVLGLTKSMALELAPFNIHVNAVIPGFVKTEMTASLSEKQFEIIRKKIPLQEFCEPEEVAETVNFLVSRAHHTTGAVTHVDGGFGLGI